MQIRLETDSHPYRIEAVFRDHCVISGVTYNESILLLPDSLIQLGAKTYDLLTLEDLNPLLSLALEVLLIGTGEEALPPRPALTAPFLARGIGVECMSTVACARTHVVLSSEGRKVASLLNFPPPSVIQPR